MQGRLEVPKEFLTTREKICIFLVQNPHFLIDRTKVNCNKIKRTLLFKKI